jgi:hypothetical protein
METLEMALEKGVVQVDSMNCLMEILMVEDKEMEEIV